MIHHPLSWKNDLQLLPEGLVWSGSLKAFLLSPTLGPQSLVCPHPASLALKRALCTNQERGLDGLSCGLPGFDSLPFFPPTFMARLPGSSSLWQVQILVLMASPWHQRIIGKRGFPLWTSLLPLGLTPCTCTIQESLSMQLEDRVRLGSSRFKT